MLYDERMLSLQKVATILGLKTSRHLPLSNCSIDSRLMQKGGLFFAIRGEKVDGHNYLQDVASEGGFAAVVDKAYVGPDFGLELLYVDNVRESLQFLAKVVMKERGTRVIGVTGSVGKTTIKEFLYTLLSCKYRIHKNPRSLKKQSILARL